MNKINISRRFCEAGGDGLGAGDCCADDHGGGTQVQGPAYLLGVGDVAFCKHRDCQAGDDELDEWPGDGADAGGLGGVGGKGRGGGGASGPLCGGGGLGWGGSGPAW